MNEALQHPEAQAHLDTLKNWAANYSDGNLVKLILHIDPWQTQMMSFTWGFYVFEDTDGQIPANKFHHNNFINNCPVHGGLIWHDRAGRYSIHT